MRTRICLASLSLLTILCLMLAGTPATAGTLYDNGPYGSLDFNAWTINYGYAVSDSFVVPSNSKIQDLHFLYWDASSTDVVLTVDMAIGTSSFGGTFLTLQGATNTFLFVNDYGYQVFEANFTFTPTFQIPWSGPGFVTLQNACTTMTGCSQSGGTPIYWDENMGVDCGGDDGHGGGCPSTAYENDLGSIPSEAFTLTGASGSGGGTTPEPGTILLFGSGILGLGGVLRRRLMG